MSPFHNMSRTRALLALALICSACVAVYLPGLSGPLLLDDYPVLVPLMQAAPAELFSSDYLISNSGPLGRPLAMLSFALNALASNADLSTWKLTNLIVHLLCGLLLFVFIVNLTRATRDTRDNDFALAVFVASVWLVHPLHVSTVLYTVQRMSALSTLFCFLGLSAYAHARVRMLAGRSGSWLIVFALSACTMLAALSKESGVLLPLFCVALEVTVFANAPRPAWLRWCLVACVVLPVLAALAYISSNPVRHLFGAYAAREFTLVERLLTEGRVVLTYLRWIVVPRRTDYGFYHDDIDISRSLTGDIATPLALIAIAILLAVAWRLRVKRPIAAFGIALFFLGNLLESTIFGLELVFEHRTYLPMVGVLLAVVDLLRRAVPVPLRLPLSCAVMTIFAVALLPRTLAWGDELTLYRTFVAIHPHSERAIVTLAEGYIARGQYADALALVTPSERLTLRLERMRILCLAEGTGGSAASEILKATAAAPQLSNFALDALLYLAEVGADQSCELPDSTLWESLEAVRGIPGKRAKRYRLNVLLARHYWGNGHRMTALARLATAAKLRPKEPFVHYLKAEWLLDLGQPEAAREAMLQARSRRGLERYPLVDRAMSEMVAGMPLR